MRTHIYVDGYNLYYGCLKHTPYKWLDIHAMCRALLRPENDIRAIRYFTAKVSGSPHDPDQPTRQQTYFRALRTLPQVSIHLGHFLSHEVTMPDANEWRQGRFVRRRVIKTEEKGSDVNLATYLLIDAFDDAFDVAVIISNDSDLKEPISVVRNRFGKTIGILNPQKHASRTLQPLVHFIKQIRPGVLRNSQFPDIMHDAKGQFHKPSQW